MGIGKRYLIAIGSPSCDQMGLATLENVESDVEKMVEFFTSEEYGQGYERVLADEIPLGATASQILDSLSEWFACETRQESDCVVVYYAGHGDIVPEIGADAHFLFTADSNRRGINRKAIQTRDLARAFFLGDGARPQSVLLIVDTCASGDGSGQAAAMVSGSKCMLRGHGAGFWVVASAAGYEKAGDGAFVEGFFRVIDEYRKTPGDHPFLSPIAIGEEIGAWLLENKEPQTVQSDIAGAKKDHKFISNPGHISGLGPRTLEDLSHWDTRARSVESLAAPGDYFVGRAAAIRELTEFLESKESDLKARVVTGRPGSGKSSVVSRLVMQGIISDASTPGSDVEKGATEQRLVDASVHARGLNVQRVVASLCRQLKINDHIDDLLRHISGLKSPIRVVVDALDESREQTLIVSRILTPLAASSQVRLVIGTRKTNEQVNPLGSDAIELDLDSSEYFDPQDIVDYVYQRLTHESPATVYAAEENRIHAANIASHVGSVADHSFLYARVVCRWLANASTPVNTSLPNWKQTINLPSEMGAVFARDMERFGDADRRRFLDLLIPLAYSRGKGLPQKRIWFELASAISGKTYTNRDIRELKEVAGFYIVRDIDGDNVVFRLFHEEFAEHLREVTRDEEVEQTIFQRLIDVSCQRKESWPDWSKVHEPYLLNNLIIHAAASGHLDELLEDAKFLVRANRLTTVGFIRDAGSALAKKNCQCFLRAYAWLGEDFATRIQQLKLAGIMADGTELVRQLNEIDEPPAWTAVATWCREPDSHVISVLPDFGDSALVETVDGKVRLVVVVGQEVITLDLSNGVEIARSFIPQLAKPKAVHPYYYDGRLLALIVDELSYGCVNLFSVDVESGFMGFVDTLNKEHSSGIYSYHVVPSEEPVLAIGFETGEIEIRSLPDLKLKKRFNAHFDAVMDIGSHVDSHRSLLLTGCDSMRKRGAKQAQVKVWDVQQLTDPVIEFEGPGSGWSKWYQLIRLQDRELLAVFFYPQHELHLFDMESGDLVCNSEIEGEPYGIWCENSGVWVLSGFGDTFGATRIDSAGNGRIQIQSFPLVKLAAGAWHGPFDSHGIPSAVTTRSDARVWNLPNLIERSKTSSKMRVGQVHPTGEPLPRFSASASGQFFASESRFANLRIWDASGQVHHRRHTATTLEDLTGCFELISMLEFDGKTLCVGVNKYGMIHCIDHEGLEWSPSIEFGRHRVSCIQTAVVDSEPIVFLGISLNDYSLVRAWNLRTGAECHDLYPADRRGEAQPGFIVRTHLDKSIDAATVVESDGELYLVAAIRIYGDLAVWNLNKRQLHASGRIPPSTKEMVGFRAGDEVLVGWINEESKLGVVSLDGRTRVTKNMKWRPKGICAVSIGEEDVLVTTSDTGRVEVWTAELESIVQIELGDWGNAIAALSERRFAVGTESGFIILELNPQLFSK